MGPQFYSGELRPADLFSVLPIELLAKVDACVDMLREDDDSVAQTVASIRAWADLRDGHADAISGTVGRAFADVLLALQSLMSGEADPRVGPLLEDATRAFALHGELRGSVLVSAAKVILYRHQNLRDEGLREAHTTLIPALQSLGTCSSRVLGANTCGVVHSDNEQLEAAATWYHTALRDAQSLGLLAREAHISANIGEMLYMCGNAREAQVLLERAAELSKLAPGPWLSTFVGTTLALSLLAQGEAKRAKAAISSLLDASDATLGPSNVSRLWFFATAGLILAECGELRAAGRHIQRGHELWPSIPERQLSPYIWWASGHLLRLEGQTDEALHHLDQAIELSAESGYAYMPMKAAHEIFEIRQERGQTELALAAHIRFHLLYERVHNQAAGLSLQLLRTQSHLLQAQRESEQHLALAKVKSRFIAMASHEFRTPLAAIQSGVELLRFYADRIDEAERESVWLSMDASFMRLKTTMEQVLLLAKSDEDKLPVRLQPLDWHAAALEVAREAQLANAKRNPVHLRCKEHALVLARPFLDLSLFRQALGNLISNACKYSGDGQAVELRCSSAELHDRAWLKIDVVDHGLGIHVDDHERLFSSFERGRNTEHISGTGLGLAIVKRAMDAMGGRVTFVSEVGRGSTFSLLFALPTEIQ